MATPRPPKTVPYSFSRLKDVPRRLVSAPSLPEWMLTSGPTLGTTPIRDAPDLSTRAEGDGSIWEDEDDQRRHPSRGKQRALRPSRPAKQASFRTVRSFKKVYMTEVKLSDVLNGRHMPPLTLRDFEDYLVYVERAPESLYFIFWLDSYRKLYAAWEQDLGRATSRNLQPTSTRSTTNLPASLSRQDTSLSTAASSVNGAPAPAKASASLGDRLEASRSTALQAFFPAPTHMPVGLPEEGSLELNLSSAVMQSTRVDALASAHPDVFRAARKEAIDMLEESMHKWLVLCSGNADGNRVTFAFALGAFSIVASLVACLVAYYYTPHRALRLPSMPVFWLGVMTFSCALYRMCPVIWLFSSSRQLHGWEVCQRSASGSATTLVLSTGPSASPDPNQDPSSSSTEKKPPLARLHSDETDVDLEAKDEESAVGFTMTMIERTQSARVAPDWDAALSEKPVGPASPLSAPPPPPSSQPNQDGPGRRPSLPAPQASAATMHYHGVAKNSLAYFDARRFECSSKSAPTPRASFALRPASIRSVQAPTFAPVTKVESPLVVRSQRNVILMSSLYGTILTAVWLAIWVAIPPHHR